MVIETTTITAMFSGLGLAIVWFLVFVAWPKYRLASFRQDLFDIRDALFDVGFEYRLYSHPSYMRLRERLNSVIRFGHKFTTTRLVITLILIKRDKLVVYPEDWTLTLNELPMNAQKALLNVHSIMVKRTACHIFRIPPSWLSSILALGNAAQREIAKKEIVAKVEILEAQAVDERKQEQELAFAAR